MSITVRLWSDEELVNIKSGRDKWLATVFMNVKTFSEEEIRHYPYNLRRAYHCSWQTFEDDNGDIWESDEATIYATDQRMLLRFIDAEYVKRPDTIDQVITQYRPLKY